MSLRLSAAETGSFARRNVVERAVVRLVEPPVGGAEVPQREGFFGLFDREEEAVRLAVYRHPREGTQRRGDAEPRHEAVGDEVFQIAVVLEGRVERELVEAAP